MNLRLCLVCLLSPVLERIKRTCLRDSPLLFSEAELCSWTILIEGDFLPFTSVVVSLETQCFN